MGGHGVRKGVRRQAGHSECFAVADVFGGSAGRLAPHCARACIQKPRLYARPHSVHEKTECGRWLAFIKFLQLSGTVRELHHEQPIMELHVALVVTPSQSVRDAAPHADVTPLLPAAKHCCLQGEEESEAGKGVGDDEAEVRLGGSRRYSTESS